MTVRVAVVQTHPRLGKIRGNLKSALSLMGKEKADIYALPELAFTGYNFSSIHQVRRFAESAGTGLCHRALAAFARKNKSYVAFGFAEKSPRGFFNSVSLIGPGGLVGTYRKIHLFGRERIFFLPGEVEFPVYDLPWGRVGLMICYDWFFPESARTLALKGAQLIVHPANLVLSHGPDAMITRCLENRVFAVTADRVGTEKGGDRPLTYIGSSQIISPRGEILARLGRSEEAVAVVSIDLLRASDKSLNAVNDLFKDRRPEFYSLNPEVRPTSRRVGEYGKGEKRYGRHYVDNEGKKSL